MKKILYITSSGAPDGMYGGSVALLNLALGLKGRVELVFVFPDKGFLSDRLQKEGFKCYVIPKYGLKWYPARGDLKKAVEFIPRLVRMIQKRERAIRNISKIVEAERPDIIHTNVGPLDIGEVVAKKYSLPHVWHIREYQDKDFNVHPFPSFASYRKQISSKSNHLISITKDVFRHFNMSDTKDTVVYDGVFHKASFMEKTVRKKYILFTGSLKSAKGVLELLEGYALYVQHGGSMPLHLLGEGGTAEYKNKCMTYVKDLNLDKLVVFLGFKDNVYDYMKEAWVQVVPSLFEGFGFITAEAMYNGCLVIGRNTGGTKEQFDNGVEFTGQEIGLRFTTTEELADHLLEVERNGIDYYTPMIDRAFRTANELYSLEKSADDVFNIYNKL